MVNVTIVIPVYNAFDEARRCLGSVLEHSPEAHRILVLDDCSPQGVFRDSLPSEWLGDSRLQVLRGEKNRGFVATCNDGLRSSAPDDVVLLNSDTEVTRGWLRKMGEAAYSRKDVGSVTPLTNNGNICSVPNFGIPNLVPEGYTIESFSELVEGVSTREYAPLPTCVGFCVYLRRKALDVVGLLDEETFGRGYGEENDLSCRFHQAGFVDIVDDATFVYHKGNMSFAGAAEELMKTNSARLREKFPHYFDEVTRFCRAAPLHNIRARILDEMVARWSASKRLNVLQIVQNGPTVERHHPLGGTELHVRDIIAHGTEHAFWSLVPSKHCYYLTAHMPGLDREYYLALGQTSLKSILKRDFFDVIHLHHSRWIDHVELCQALIEHGRYLVSFHDYILVCPRFHLMTPTRKVCSGHECVSSCGYVEPYIAEYRANARALLNGASKVICFSESTRSYIRQILEGDFKWHQSPHGIVNVTPRKNEISTHSSPTYSPTEPFRIAFVGMIPQHKGSLIIEQVLTRRAAANGTPLEWHILGKLFADVGECAIQHGTYKPEEFRDKLRAVNPHVVAILSICPETYCLTLDETWNAGVPVIVTPLGAPAERVSASGAGWVLDNLTAESFLRTLDSVVADWNGYSAVREKVQNTKIRSTAEEAQEYYALYDTAGGVRASNVQTLLTYLRRFSLVRPPTTGLFRKIAGRGVDKAIYIVEHFRLRPTIERALYAVLPRKVLERIKHLRQSR